LRRKLDRVFDWLLFHNLSQLLVIACHSFYW
jgi:hypothetical protein